MITLQTLEQNEIDIIMPRVQDEMNAHYFYEAAELWCRSNGYNKAAKYYHGQAHEENHHYKKWVKFLSDWNVKIDFPTLQKPPKFISLIDILEQQYQIEFNLGESYEVDAISMFPLCQAIYKLILKFVQIQNDSVIECNNLLTAAYKYQNIDPNLVLYESKIF